MTTILDQIIRYVRRRVAEDKKRFPESAIRQRAEEQGAAAPAHRFRKALEGDGIQIIAEVKKASPSKGLICEDFDPVAIAEEYHRGGAAAISVLTEEKYFQGDIRHLEEISQATGLPTLRKDFIIDEFQIYEAAARSASAVLLITAALSRRQLGDFLALAESLHLDALVEVHDSRDLDKALTAEAGIIGINNRNLKTFRVSTRTSLELVHEIPPHVVRVSESGIDSREDVVEMEQAGFDAVLIGTTLMQARDRAGFLQELRGANVG